MSHTVLDKQKLLNRVRRLQGQLAAVERALVEEQQSYRILQTLAACRGAINGLMAQVIQGHIRLHVIDPKRKPTSEQTRAAEELIDVVKSYLK